MPTLPPLLVDRFLLRTPTQALDLATGDAVIVRRHAWRHRADEARWAECCAHFLHLSHNAICALVDYGPCSGAQSFEAWRSDGAWNGDAGRARDCIGLAERYLQSCGLTRAARGADLHSVDGAPALLPETISADATEYQREPGGRDVGAEPFGVCVDTPACAISMSEALTDARPQRPRVFSVWADEARDVALAYRHVARAARLCGFLPIAINMLPAARGRLAGRSICLLSPLPAAASWQAWLAVSLQAGRAVVLVCTDADPPGSVVRLPSPHLPFEELLRSLRPRACADAALPVVRRAARQAQGSPSRFGAALVPASASSVLRWPSTPSGATAPARAGEPRVAYGTSTPSAGDLVVFRGRMRQAVQAIEHGRHAAGQRALRRAVGALSRRHDHAHVVLGGLDLARLHLRRGRLKEARAALADASQVAHRAERHDLLTHIAVLSGVISLHELRLDESEALLRTARTVAEGLGEPEIVHASARGLARCLFWRGHYDEALQLLSDLPDSPDDPRSEIRVALARSSVAVGTGDLASAVTFADRAGTLAAASVPELTASAATALAFCHLTVGDARALRDDVGRAVAAARRTHRPLWALRARLIWAEAERRAGRPRAARTLAERVGRMRGLPPLLRAQAALLGDLLRADDERVVLERHARVTGLEALSLFVPAGTNPAMPARHVLTLLECCQAAEGEQALLQAVCERLRPMLDAAATAFVARTPSGLAVVAGSGGRVGFAMAERVETLGESILPHAAAHAIESGVPVRYGGRAIGVLVARWPLGTRPLGRECGALMATAATAAAPALAMHTARQRRVDLGVRDTGLLGNSTAMEAVRHAVSRAALAPFPVLIQGESGSGKELVARAVHRQSARRDRPLCTVNCAALPDDLVESELFGHARGAFTGALNERIGVFEAAHQGTLFLDEIGELSLRAQAKVLRTVQDGEVRRVGENVSRRVDARLIAATNRNLREEVDAGRFRGDLLYRLDVIRILIPPLRERRDDVPVLGEALWHDAIARVGSRATLATATLAQLARYDWPGNVRELQNVLAALAVQAPRSGVIGPASLPSALQTLSPSSGARLDQARRAFEAEFVRAALARAGGQRTRAAEELGVTRQGLTKMIARHGLAAGVDSAESDGHAAGNAG